MNHQLKRSIQKAFAAPKPDPQEKARFLKTLPQPQIGMFRFILVQASYLRKATWILSGLILLLALFAARNMRQDTLWIISAFVPVLGLLAVTESTRSMTYGMSEFEMSTRFSLKSVVLARMSILGLINFAVIAILTPLCRIGNDFSLLQTGMYLLVPYLLTVNFSLWIARRVNGKETIYGCMCAAVIVSGINTGLHFVTDLIYQEIYTGWWLALSVFLLFYSSISSPSPKSKKFPLTVMRFPCCPSLILSLTSIAFVFIGFCFRSVFPFARHTSVVAFYLMHYKTAFSHIILEAHLLLVAFEAVKTEMQVA